MIMEIVRKIAGLIILFAGLMAIVLVLEQAINELGGHPDMEQKVFWPVILPVFLPVAAGFLIFGYFALQGEYSSNTEEKSEEKKTESEEA